MSANSEKKKGAGEAVKQLAPCWIISFVFCYMLFVYEPLMMYGTNKDDFWFDFGIMIIPTLKIFAIFFFGAAAVLTALYFLCRRFSPELKPYRIVLTAVFAVFLALYIQGNYLAAHLPALDGSEIDWGAYASDDIVTIIVWLVIAAGLTFALIKFDLEGIVVCLSGISIAVFLMLTVSLVTTAARNDLFSRKNNLISTTEGFNEVSSDKNFFIFMVDSQSATEFTYVITALDQFEHSFDDFTYYPDTLSVYAYTRDSLPFVLSGHVNRNEEDFGDYSERALNDSVLFNALDERGYDMYLYDSELAWYGEKEHSIKNNPDFGSVKLKFGEYFDNEMRYVWFKYLPYAYKKASGIEGMNFGRTVEKFKWGNDTLYHEFRNVRDTSKTSGNQFRLIHAEGAHVPLDMDEHFNRIKGGTYLQKTVATAKLIEAFIDRLKWNGVYDDSVIIIMADHGYQPALNQPENYILSRFNPILLIKGAGEKHDFIVSDKPVSYLDLPQAYIELLDGKQSTELFPDVGYPRTRNVIWYEIYKEEHMVEYETDGTATNWDKFRETGNVFDLEK